VAVVALVAFYNAQFAFSFLPLTEGWFSLYALLIRDGHVPYRDFYLYLTPLYPLLMAGMTALLGDTFFALRLAGVAIVAVMALLLYLILTHRFRHSTSALAAVVA
jgi:hypothetical protein